MTIFLTTLKRLFRSKSNILFLLILPLIFMLIAFSGSNGTAQLKVGVVDKDRETLSNKLIDNIKKKSEVITVNEDEIQKKLIDNEIDYALVIEEGFTQDIINGNKVEIQGYEAKEGNTSTAIKLSLNEYVNKLMAFGQNSKGNEAVFYDLLKYYEEGSYKVSYISVDKGEGNKSKTVAAMGFIVLNMLFSATSAANIILKDKEKNVFTRLFTTPLKRFRYIVESLFAFLVVTFIQVTVYFMMFKYLFKFNLGETPFNLYILLLIFGVFTISLGVFTATHAKNIRQAGTINTLINIPFAMLGGCFWPREIMPGFLKKMSDFIPTTWINTANSDVLFGAKLTEVFNNISMLLFIALILLILSSRKLKNSN